MRSSTRWLAARATLRDYVRHALYADLPLGTPVPTLRLARQGPVRVEAADLYASRPGADDPRFDEDGRVVPRRGVGLGPRTDDPTGAQAGSVDAGWRAYLERELAAAPETAIELDRETVLLAAGQIGSRHWRAIYELGHRANVKRLALDRQVSVGAVKAESAQALDALLDRLYRVSERRRAS